MEQSVNVTRQTGLKNLLVFKDKSLIKVITGIRRCGKSTLLAQFKEYLLQNGTVYIQVAQASEIHKRLNGNFARSKQSAIRIRN